MARHTKTVDGIRDEIITDIGNLDPDIDTATGSLVYILVVAFSAAIWGVYQFLNYCLDQIHPDTSDEVNLERHAADYRLSRLPAETPEALLERVLERKAYAPAGGNKFDYERWARSVPGVANAYCLPINRGAGTVDILVVADPDLYAGEEIPDAPLLAAVLAYVDPLRPVGMAAVDPVLAIPPVIDTQAVAITAYGNGDYEGAAAEIDSYLAGFAPGQPLYPEQLAAITLAYGFNRATVVTPAAGVTPTATHMLRPGVIDVTVA